MQIPAEQIETIRIAIEALNNQPLNQSKENIELSSLPADAGDMTQLVKALDYPQTARGVMEKHHNYWSNRRSLH